MDEKLRVATFNWLQEQSIMNGDVFPRSILEPIELLGKESSCSHFDDSIEDGKLSFEYTLKSDELKNTNAIRILKINEFPEEITREAVELVGQIRNQKKISFRAYKSVQ